MYVEPCRNLFVVRQQNERSVWGLAFNSDLTEQQFATLNPTVYPSCGSSLQTGVSVCLGNRKLCACMLMRISVTGRDTRSEVRILS